MTVSDRVRRARFDTISAKNAAVVIDVINLGVALSARNAILRGVFGSLYIYAVRGARRRAQEARHTHLQAVFIALQNVLAAKALLKLGTLERSRTVGIVLDNRRLEHLFQGDSHSLGNRADVFDDGHSLSSIAERRLSAHGWPHVPAMHGATNPPRFLPTDVGGTFVDGNSCSRHCWRRRPFSNVRSR